ncbi:hypothetical protein [Dongshaea marina]|uniref:hypothetical protein n=1 Tax=Dongshaea marina TaxID=2047966 RepID=UPI00131EDF24|nr:hypothetical protein [Dongshaea marina]
MNSVPSKQQEHFTEHPVVIEFIKRIEKVMDEVVQGRMTVSEVTHRFETMKMDLFQHT